MNEAPFVEAHLVGFFPPDFSAKDRVLMRIEEGAAGMLPPEDTPRTRIYDARPVQEAARSQRAISEAAFFEEHGFVLLEHESAVADWDVDTAAPGNSISEIYLPEVESLVRGRLFPEGSVDVWQGPPMRRGPGTQNPIYAGGVHQDFGVTPDDYQESIEVFTSAEIGQLWRDRYEREDVAGFVAIDFWRTAGMRGPLRHMPLCVSDPSTIRVEDVVPLGLVDFSPTGRPTNQSGLRYQPDQRWYYYSEMGPDEVLAFKQFEYWKDTPEPRPTCFHSAFELPTSLPDVEIRQSSEQRVLVFCLRS